MKRDTFIILKPTSLTLPLILKANENNDRVFIILDNKANDIMGLKELDLATLCFHINTSDHAAVLHLISKISKEFSISAVVPGCDHSLVLARKITSFLNQP